MYFSLRSLWPFFFFNDTATTEIYTLSLHDALPISRFRTRARSRCVSSCTGRPFNRSEEHTSELQSPCNLVCRLLLEKKKQIIYVNSDDPHQHITEPKDPRIISH